MKFKKQQNSNKLPLELYLDIFKSIQSFPYNFFHIDELEIDSVDSLSWWREYAIKLLTTSKIIYNDFVDKAVIVVETNQMKEELKLYIDELFAEVNRNIQMQFVEVNRRLYFIETRLNVIETKCGVTTANLQPPTQSTSSSLQIIPQSLAGEMSSSSIASQFVVPERCSNTTPYYNYEDVMDNPITGNVLSSQQTADSLFQNYLLQGDNTSLAVNENFWVMEGSHPIIRPNPNFNSAQTLELLLKALNTTRDSFKKCMKIIISCSNMQRQEVLRLFQNIYGLDLISKFDFHDYVRELIIALFDIPSCFDAKSIFRNVGKEDYEHILIEIMLMRSNEEKRQIHSFYQQLYGLNLGTNLMSEPSSFIKRLLVALCNNIRDETMKTYPAKAMEDARKLYECIESTFEAENDFIEIISLQNLNQLKLVFYNYSSIYGQSIEQSITNKLNGHLRECLLALIVCITNPKIFFCNNINKFIKKLGSDSQINLLRILISRSEIDLHNIRSTYEELFNRTLQNHIGSNFFGSFKLGLMAIINGFIN